MLRPAKWSGLLSQRYGDAAVALLDQGFVSAVNFLTIVLLARNLSLHEFGVFMLAHMGLTLLTTLQNAGFAQPHNILGAQRTGSDYARFTAVLGLLQLLSSLLIVVLLCLTGVALQASSPYATIVFALAAAALPWMGQEFVRRVLYTQGDSQGAALNDAVSYGLQLLGLIVLIVPAFGWNVTPAAALLVLGASSLVAMIFGVWQLRASLSLSVLRTLPELQSLRSIVHVAADTWRLSKWLLAQQVVAWLGSSGHGWILAALLGPANFGVYRATYQVVNVLNPMRQAATNHLPSRAARTFAAEGIGALRTWQFRTLAALGLPFSLCAVAIVVAAEPLARLMYAGHVELPHLHWLVALGALAYAVNFARTPLDYAAMVVGGARLLFIRMLWITGFVATVGVALIWMLGIPGAFVSELAAALLALWLTVRLQAAVFGSNPSAHALPAAPFTPVVENRR